LLPLPIFDFFVSAKAPTFTLSASSDPGLICANGPIDPLDSIFDSSITELMTLFWHDHFATSADVVVYPPAMYHQNKALRDNSIGNFKELITMMTFDPAMMIWLDNNQNSVGSINENFARELLELFTLGEGNYTQDDVTEAARSLTGYFTDGLNIFFVPDLFDNGEKTFLGQTGNFDAYDIIDIIFEQEQTAYFIAEKIYKYFILTIFNSN